MPGHGLLELKRYCLERAASARHRVTVAALIQKGISPNDPRLGAIASECLRFDPSMLKSDFACVTSEESGARVQTRCAQQFGRQDTFGRLQPLEPRAAVDLYFATGTFALAEVENEQGGQERLQRADEQRRMAEAQTLRTQIDAFRSSRSELVRSHAQSLIQKLSWNPPPSRMAIEAARQDQQALTELSRAEAERIEALEKLES